MLPFDDDQRMHLKTRKTVYKNVLNPWNTYYTNTIVSEHNNALARLGALLNYSTKLLISNWLNTAHNTLASTERCNAFD